MLRRALLLGVALFVAGACEPGSGYGAGFEDDYDHEPLIDDYGYYDDGYADDYYLEDGFWDEIDAAYAEAYREACAAVLADGPLYADGQPYDEEDCLDGLDEQTAGDYVDPDDAADPAYDEPVGEPSD